MAAATSDQSALRSEEICQVVIKIDSLQAQETVEDALHNDERGCSKKLCECLVPVVEIKPSMRLAQMEGKKVLKELMFPLFNDTIRELVTYLNAVFAAVFGPFAIIADSIILTRAPYNDHSDHTIAVLQYVHIAFWILVCLLSLLDFSIVIIYVIINHRCKSVRVACTRCNNWCSNRNESVEFEPIPGEAAPSMGSTSCSIFKHNKYIDLIRLVLMGICIYPLTISSLLKGLLSIRQNDTVLRINHSEIITGLSMTEFAMIACWNLFFYVLCSAVIFWTICVSWKRRKVGSIVKTAWLIDFWFIFHAMGQLVVQVLMIVCIGAKMYYENREYSVDGTVRISPYLWYMIVGGYFIPFAGVFTFTIFNFYRIQEYPIEFFIDLLYKEIKFTKISTGEAEETRISPKTEIVASILMSDFEKLHNVGTLNKCAIILKRPFLLVTFLVVYALSLLAFAICCVLDPDYMTGETNFVVLDGSTTGWVVFFTIGVVLVILVNLLVPLVVVTWKAITFIYNRCSGKQHPQRTTTESS